jgi:hypothetical protein
MKQYLALLFCAVTFVYPQQRILISPKDEVIPLRRGENAFTVAKKYGFREANFTNCGTQFTFGYDEAHFPATSNFALHHKDVLAEWFVAKASGRIDTIFWENLGSVGALDSIVSVRIHKSNIGPAAGPGIRPGPFNPPCQQWGYYVNVNDSDRGIAPFKDEATDTNWVSTYTGDSASFDPFGDEIWGNGGYQVKVHAGKINFVGLDTLLQKPDITVGEPFFISLKMNSANTHPDSLDARTEFAASGFHVDKNDESYPSRDWKFYEHDSGPSNCAGIPSYLVKRGWVARGGFTTDTLDVALYNIWYTMTVTTNTPPSIDTLWRGLSSIDSTNLCFSFPDCDPSAPQNHILYDTIWFRYSINDGPLDSLVSSPDSTTLYCLKFPPVANGARICTSFRYHYSDGHESVSSIVCQSVVTALNENRSILPDKFSLYQNYPNPFNPTTEIRFDIPEEGYVSIKIFDVLGREVATLVNEKKTAGHYSVSWDASAVPSGVYFYRLQTEKFSDVKKMLLLR